MSSVARSSVFVWKRLQKINNFYMLNVVNGVNQQRVWLAGWMGGRLGGDLSVASIA